MFDFLIDLPIVNNQSKGSRSGFRNLETQTAMMGVVPLLMILHEVSINTFLYLALDFSKLFLKTGVGTTSHSRFLKLSFEFQVHLDQLFAAERGRQGAEHPLRG